jgi:multicomponent Na+:H+ antiporter subunit E
VRYVLVTLFLLILTFALVLGSFAPWDLVIGAVISGVLIYGTRRFTFSEEPASPSLFSRFVHFWPFAAAEIWIITQGTWEVALVTLHIRPLVSPGIVAVPIEDRTPTGVAVSALATTLSPGTFLVDVDWKHNVMLIHSIDASDPEAVREDHQRFYRRYQRKVFP